jgi:hypothetical protein
MDEAGKADFHALALALEALEGHESAPGPEPRPGGA